MRHGKFAIIEGNSYFDCVHELEDNEEYQYDPHTFMIKKWEHINYGIGTDIQTAFEDFKKRYK